MIAAAFVGIALASMPVAAQQTKAVGGFIVSLGVVPAAVALRAEGHRESHPANPPFGEVLIEVTDPNGHKEKKPLLHTEAGGFADYSELFRFTSPGAYSIRAMITLRPGAQAIETTFTIKHAI